MPVSNFSEDFRARSMARKLQSDKWLFLATLALVCASVVMVYSASALVALERFQQPYLFVTKQLMWALSAWPCCRS